MLSSQPYKGTRDFYPADMRAQRWMFGKMRELVESFGYEEYNGPMLEPFELYAAKSGEELVNQQLFWLMDKGERKLAVRPEMTPTLARMVAAKIHELPRPIRWFSLPNLWRYERPQRGRLREHWQLNVDILGGDPLLADAEILTLALELMRKFGGESLCSIRVNNRRLMDHFFTVGMSLKPEQALAVTKAVDARAKIGEESYGKWLGELGIDDAGRDRLEKFFHMPFEQMKREYACQGIEELHGLFRLLKQAGVEQGRVQFDPTIMRGLDYYTGTVFEMYDNSPENKRAMFGGGRYDNLTGLFGKEKLPGVGFGMGDVTMAHFLETHALMPKFDAAVDVFVSLPTHELRPQAEKLARELRERGLSAMTPLSCEGFGPQLKIAARHGARFSVLFGESELEQGDVIVKEMSTGKQELVKLDAAPGAIAARVRQ
jgi:histidyl-tRNA synthetase